MLVPPSAYYWLQPRVFPAAKLDELANKGEFPSLLLMIPALWYCLLFGVARYFLTEVAFKPMALHAMDLKIAKHDKPIREVDEYFSPRFPLFSIAWWKYLGGFSRAPEAYTSDPHEPSAGGTVAGSKKKLRRRLKTGVELVKEVYEKCATASLCDAATLRTYMSVFRANKKVEMKVVKFIEAMWRGIFYSIFVGLGAYTLFYPSPVAWVLDVTHMWIKWPQAVDDLVIIYYQLSLGCYLHQLMWTEVVRDDAVEMIIHHCATILLLTMSLLTQFTRIGTAILLCHDIADIFLESAKCFNYAANNSARCKAWAKPLCDVLFACFAVSFMVTRLWIFPKYLWWSLYQHAPENLNGVWPGWFLYIGLLWTLQGLHIYWFYLILKMVRKMFTTGIDKDERSDDEDDDDKDK